MQHSQQHQPRLVPPSSSSAPIRNTYVHQYSYSLPGQGSYFKMNRVYTRPHLPSFVGTEQFRSSSAPADFYPNQQAQSQLGRLKDSALLSSLSFLPDDSVDNLSQDNNSSAYHNPRYDPFNPRYAVSPNRVISICFIRLKLNCCCINEEGAKF